MSAMQTSSAGPTVSVAAVSKWFGNVVAVNDVSFDIHPGITGFWAPTARERRPSCT